MEAGEWAELTFADLCQLDDVKKMVQREVDQTGKRGGLKVRAKFFLSCMHAGACVCVSGGSIGAVWKARRLRH